MAFDKQIQQELQHIRGFLFNSLSVTLNDMAAEAKSQSKTLLMISDSLKGGGRGGKGGNDTSDKSETAGKGGVGFKDIVSGVQDLSKALPKLALGLLAFSLVPKGSLLSFFRGMTNAITLDGTYKNAKGLAALYDAAAGALVLIAGCMKDLTKGLKLFQSIGSPDKFVTFVKSLMDGLKSIKKKQAKDAAEGIIALAEGVLKFSGYLALSLPLLILGIPGILLAVPAMLLMAVSMKLVTKIIGNKKAAKDTMEPLMYMSAAIAIFAVALLILRLVQPVDFLKALALILLFAGFVIMMSLAMKVAGGPKASKEVIFTLVAFSLALGVLALSLLIFKFVGWMEILKGVVVLTVMALIVLTLGMFKDQSKWGALIIVAFALSFLLVTLVLLIYKTIEWETIAKSMAVLTTLAVLSIFLGTDKDQAIGGAICLIALAGALLITAFSLKLYDDATWKSVGIATYMITALTVVTIILSELSTQVIYGAFALMVVSVSLIAVAGSLAIMVKSGVTIETVGLAALMLVTVALTCLSFGISPVPELTMYGGLALSVASLSLVIVSGALLVFKKANFDMKMLGNIATCITTIGLAFASIGAPWTAPFIFLGGAAMIPAGLALIAVAAALLVFSNMKVPIKDLVGTEDQPGAIEQTIMSVGTVFARVGKMWGGGMLTGPQGSYVKAGIESVAGVGRVLVDIASGVRAFANLTFVEYDAKGKGKIVNIPQEWLTSNGKIPLSIQGVVGAVGDAFAKLGETGGEVNWWSNNKIQSGIKSVKGVGKELVDIAEGVKAFANLSFKSYDSKGKEMMVNIPETWLKKDTGKIPVAIQSVVSSISDVFATIGKGNPVHWWSNNDIESGKKSIDGVGDNLVKIAQAVKDFADLEFTDSTGKKVKLDLINDLGPAKLVEGPSIGGVQYTGGKVMVAILSVITSLSSVLQRIGASDGKTPEFDIDAIEAGKELVTGVGDMISPIAKAMIDVATSIEKQQPAVLTQAFSSFLYGMTGSIAAAGRVWGPDMPLITTYKEVIMEGFMPKFSDMVKRSTDAFDMFSARKSFTKDFPGYFDSINLAIGKLVGDKAVGANQTALNNFDRLVRGMNTMAASSKLLESVASSMEKISNAVTKMTDSLNKFGSANIKTTSEMFKNIADIGKLPVEQFSAKFAEVNNFLDVLMKNQQAYFDKVSEQNKKDNTELQGTAATLKDLIAVTNAKLDGISTALGTLRVEVMGGSVRVTNDATNPLHVAN